MNRTAMGFSALVLLAFAVSVAHAQVTAQQGRPSVDPAKRFKSPMVLEVPMPQLQGVSDQRSISVPGIREFHCEDVSIASLTVDVSTSRNGERAYVFNGMLLVDESFDRFVTIDLALKDGEAQPFGHARELNIPAEEQRVKPFSVRFKVGSGTASAIDGAMALSLQIMMHVRED